MCDKQHEEDVEELGDRQKLTGERLKTAQQLDSLTGDGDAEGEVDIQKSASLLSSLDKSAQGGAAAGGEGAAPVKLLAADIQGLAETMVMEKADAENLLRKCGGDFLLALETAVACLPNEMLPAGERRLL